MGSRGGRYPPTPLSSPEYTPPPLDPRRPIDPYKPSPPDGTSPSLQTPLHTPSSNPQPKSTLKRKAVHLTYPIPPAPDNHRSSQSHTSPHHRGERPLLMRKHPTSTQHNHLRTQTLPPYPPERPVATVQRQRANTLSPKRPSNSPPSYTSYPDPSPTLPLTSSSRSNRERENTSKSPPTKRQKVEGRAKEHDVDSIDDHDLPTHSTHSKSDVEQDKNKDVTHPTALGISYPPFDLPSWSSFHPRDDESTVDIQHGASSIIRSPLFPHTRAIDPSPSPTHKTRPRSNAFYQPQGRHRITKQYSSPRGSSVRDPLNGRMVHGILINPYRQSPGSASSSKAGSHNAESSINWKKEVEVESRGSGSPQTPVSEHSLRAGVSKNTGRTVYAHVTTPIPPRRIAFTPRSTIGQCSTSDSKPANPQDSSSLPPDLDNDDDFEILDCPPTPTLRASSRYRRERSPTPSRSTQPVSTLTTLHDLSTPKDDPPPYSPPSIPKPTFSSCRESGSLTLNPKRGVTVTPGHEVQGGDTLIKTEPMYKVLHSGLLGNHCSGCFMSAEHKSLMERPRMGVEWLRTRYLTCRCGIAVFCSAECYAKTAAEHADECRAFGYGMDVPNAEARLIARIVFSMRASSKNKPDWKSILPDYTMPQVHESEVHDLGRLIRQVMIFLKASRGSQTFRLEDHGLSDRKDLMNMIRRIRTMMFVVHDADSIPLGYCISPMIGRINHSCRPSSFVAFPFGTGVARSMRVIALDPQCAEDEITISYVHSGMPCHERLEALAPFGFTHECAYCARDVSNVDIRWSVRHRNCDRDGLVALTDTDPKDEMRKGKCSGCARSSWAEVSDTPLREIMERVGESLKAEMEGDWIVPGDSMSSETQLLRTEIDNLLEVFPDTFHPIPFLQRRLTRLLIAQPNDENDLSHLITAMEYLDTASLAFRDLHQDEPRPIIASMLMEKVDAHLKAVRVIMDWEETRVGSESGGGGKRGSDGKVWVGVGGRPIIGKEKGKSWGGAGARDRARLDERVELHLKEAKEGLEIVGDDLLDLWGRGCEGAWQFRRAARAERQVKKLREKAMRGGEGLEKGKMEVIKK